MPFGTEGPRPQLPDPGGLKPLEAIRASVRLALLRRPCVVAFSGGRDSSALLAVAADVAKREGLEPPVPVSLRFPHAPFANEEQWQELVIGHLGLADWVRLEYGDELDYVGPWAKRALAEHGLLWPANWYVHMPSLEFAGEGSLIDGVDGDSIFDWGHLQAVQWIRQRTRPSRRALANAKDMLRSTRQRRTRFLNSGFDLPWLTPDAMAEATRLQADDVASEPIWYDSRAAWYLGSRHARMLEWTTRLLADRTGTLLVRPFLDPLFLASWAKLNGKAGFAGRTAAMRRLFGDLLPTAVIERSGKGMYWHYWGDHSRALAADWAGEGVDPLYVNHQALRRAWESKDYPTPDHRTALLLQSVWLARR